MDNTQILFSVNDYDRDGSVLEKGIYLHFGGARVKVAESLDDFRDFSLSVENMIREIESGDYSF